MKNRLHRALGAVTLFSVVLPAIAQTAGAGGQAAPGGTTQPAAAQAAPANAATAPASPQGSALSALDQAAASTSQMHFGLALTAGLSGLGADLGVGFNDYFGMRLSGAGFSISHNGVYGTDVSWDAKLRLLQTGLTLDAYPFAGGFHVSAGLVRDSNKITLTGQPTGTTFTFNNNQYPSAAIPYADASVTWGTTKPYLGLGWGNLTGSAGFHFTSDFGVIFTGSPSANINVGCNQSAIPSGTLGSQGQPLSCSTLTGDVASEQAKLQNDVHKISFWPVARIGIGYAF